MGFLIFNVVIFVFDFILHWLLATKARHMFKNKYPDLTIPKSHWSESCLSYIKIVLFHLCPILNILFVFVYLFKTDEICEGTVERVYQRCIKEERNDL